MLSSQPYIEERAGDYYIRGKRVPLISVIYVWHNGALPETIVEKFPVLTLAEVYGAIAFYLEQREALDQHFVRMREEEDIAVAPLTAANAAFRAAIKKRLAIS